MKKRAEAAEARVRELQAELAEAKRYVQAKELAQVDALKRAEKAEAIVSTRNHELHAQSVRTDDQYARAEKAEARVRRLTDAVLSAMGATTPAGPLHRELRAALEAK